MTDRYTRYRRPSHTYAYLPKGLPLTCPTKPVPKVPRVLVEMAEREQGGGQREGKDMEGMGKAPRASRLAGENGGQEGGETASRGRR